MLDGGSNLPSSLVPGSSDWSSSEPDKSSPSIEPSHGLQSYQETDESGRLTRAWESAKEWGEWASDWATWTRDSTFGKPLSHEEIAMKKWTDELNRSIQQKTKQRQKIVNSNYEADLGRAKVPKMVCDNWYDGQKKILEGYKTQQSSVILPHPKEEETTPGWKVKPGDSYYEGHSKLCQNLNCYQDGDPKLGVTSPSRSPMSSNWNSADCGYAERAADRLQWDLNNCQQEVAGYHQREKNNQYASASQRYYLELPSSSTGNLVNPNSVWEKCMEEKVKLQGTNAKLTEEMTKLEGELSKNLKKLDRFASDQQACGKDLERLERAVKEYTQNFPRESKKLEWILENPGKASVDILDSIENSFTEGGLFQFLMAFVTLPGRFYGLQRLKDPKQWRLFHLLASLTVFILQWLLVFSLSKMAQWIFSHLNTFVEEGIQNWRSENELKRKREEVELLKQKKELEEKKQKPTGWFRKSGTQVKEQELALENESPIVLHWPWLSKILKTNGGWTPPVMETIPMEWMVRDPIYLFIKLEKIKQQIYDLRREIQTELYGPPVLNPLSVAFGLDSTTQTLRKRDKIRLKVSEIRGKVLEIGKRVPHAGKKLLLVPKNLIRRTEETLVLEFGQNNLRNFKILEAEMVDSTYEILISFCEKTQKIIKFWINTAQKVVVAAVILSAVGTGNILPSVKVDISSNQPVVSQVVTKPRLRGKVCQTLISNEKRANETKSELTPDLNSQSAQKIVSNATPQNSQKSKTILSRPKKVKPPRVMTIHSMNQLYGKSDRINNLEDNENSSNSYQSTQATQIPVRNNS